MQLIAISFFLGILLLMQFQFLPSLWYLCLLPIACLLLRYKQLYYLSFILFGFLWAWFQAELILKDELHLALEGESITVVGEILSLPEEKSYGQRFIFNITDEIVYKNQTYSSPGKVRLSWRNPPIELRPGQVWKCQVKLKRPVGFSNPGGFDYEFWLFHQGIRATGYVLDNTCETLGIDSYKPVQTLRYHFREHLQNNTSDSATVALMTALLIGDRSLLSSDQWQVLQQTGTSHLLAISGLHIGLVFGLVFFVSKIVFRLSKYSMEWMPVTRLSLYLSLLIAVFYAALAGFSLPTQRALTMLLITVLAVIRYQKISISNLIAASLFIILLMDPFAIRTAGFWLSFMAVCIILFGMCYRVQTKGVWWQWGRVQYLISIALIPLVFFWFQTQAPMGFLANIVAIPIVSFTVVPFLLFYAVFIDYLPQIAQASLTISEYGLQFIWMYLSYLSQFNDLILPMTRPALVPVILAMLGVMWFLLPRGFPAKYLSVILLLPLLFSSPKVPEEGAVWLHILDVGQGLSIILQTPEKTLIYDTGPRFSQQFNAGSAVVVPFLKQQGIKQIDKMLISHGDNDHIGGLNDILARMPVDEVLYNQTLSAPGINTDQRPCNERQSWQWGRVQFQILHPHSSANLNELDRNQSSCVLRISLFDKSILFTGDIDWKIEQQLLDNQLQQLHADILIVPHHGSKSSSSEAFIKQVSPEYAVVSSGYRNRFGFPKQVIMQRYEKRGVTLLNTADSGMISFSVSKDALSYSTHRDSYRRFWHTNP